MKKATGNENSQTQSMGPEDFRHFVRYKLRNQVQNFAVLYIEELIREEITELCGRPGERKKSRDLAHRGGSQPGWIIMDGQQVQIDKARAEKRRRRNFPVSICGSLRTQ